MNLYENFIQFIDLDNPEFAKAGKVHDWRNYVPDDWQLNWDKFTHRERNLIAVMAEIQAENEEWD